MSSRKLAGGYTHQKDYGENVQLGNASDPKAADAMGVSILQVSDGGTGIGLDMFRDGNRLGTYALRTAAIRDFAMTILDACDEAERSKKH